MRKQVNTRTPIGSRPPYFDRLLQFARRKGRTQEDAEDLVQEALLRLHVYARENRVANEEAFLRHAVNNLSIDQHRRDRPDLHPTVPIDDIYGIDEHLEWISVNPNHEEIIETLQRLDTIGALLEASSTRTREIYIAHRLGYSYGEIMEHMNISAITISRHIARALRIIKEHQAKEHRRREGNPFPSMPSVATSSSPINSKSRTAIPKTAPQCGQVCGPESKCHENSVPLL